MRSSTIKLLVTLNVILFLMVGCNNGNKESTVNEFSIYLVKDLSITEAIRKKLNDLPLETIPVLTDKEIRTYNWTEHEFTIRKALV